MYIKENKNKNSLIVKKIISFAPRRGKKAGRPAEPWILAVSLAADAAPAGPAAAAARQPPERCFHDAVAALTETMLNHPSLQFLSFYLCPTLSISPPPFNPPPIYKPLVSGRHKVYMYYIYIPEKAERGNLSVKPSGVIPLVGLKWQTIVFVSNVFKMLHTREREREGDNGVFSTLVPKVLK